MSVQPHAVHSLPLTDSHPALVAADGADASPVVKESLAVLFPEDITPDAFSSQYLQQHSSNAAAVVAVASVSPLAQAEELVFGLVQPESSPSIVVSWTFATPHNVLLIVFVRMRRTQWRS